jgi:hypothetical protein
MKVIVIVLRMRVTDFRNLVLGVVQVAQKYVDMYIDKNPPRIANTSDYGWLLETLKTPDECHKQLRMSTEIFIDLHDLLVSRYGLQPSMHMNTYETLAIFLLGMSQIGNPKIDSITLVKPSA